MRSTGEAQSRRLQMVETRTREKMSSSPWPLGEGVLLSAWGLGAYLTKLLLLATVLQQGWTTVEEAEVEPKQRLWGEGLDVSRLVLTIVGKIGKLGTCI